MFKEWNTRKQNPLREKSLHQLVIETEGRGQFELMRRYIRSTGCLTTVIIGLMIVQILVALLQLPSTQRWIDTFFK